jgi:hypothetical protein
MNQEHYVLAISIAALLGMIVMLPLLVLVLRKVTSIDARLKSIEAQREEELHAVRFPKRA